MGTYIPPVAPACLSLPQIYRLVSSWNGRGRPCLTLAVGGLFHGLALGREEASAPSPQGPGDEVVGGEGMERMSPGA